MSEWIKGRPSVVMTWVGRGSPRVWASIYLLVIPLAGLAFYELPAGSFFDSNLTREAGYKHDIATLANLLTSAVKNQEYRAEPNVGSRLAEPKWKFKGQPLFLPRNSVYVPAGSISVDFSGDITFSIQGWAQYQRTKDTSKSSAIVGGNLADLITLTTPPSNDATVTKNGVTTGLVGYTVSFSAEGTPPREPPLAVLLPDYNGALGGTTSLNPSSSTIYVPFSTSLIIDSLSGTGQGDPKEASGLFIRMCYLSAVTITTLGFGDITPASSFARALVGFEAVLGVVLIGLFLNAVGQKWGRR